MRCSKILSAVLLIAAFISAPATVRAQQELPQPVSYKYAERDSALYLDVYKPVNPRPDKASVMILFGGGFIMGSRDSRYIRMSAQPLLERGFTVIAIDYRLGMKDRDLIARNSKLTKAITIFTTCVDWAVEDCSEAIAWVCRNSDMLGIDQSRMVLTGNSAGAVTVLDLDHSRTNGKETTRALPQGWKPAAVIPYAGGVLCRDREFRYKSAPAPTLLFHGTKDRIVNYKKFGLPFQPKLHGSAKVDRMLDRQGYPHWIIRCEDDSHEVAGWLPGTVDIFCAFVEMALAGRSSTVDATLSDSDLSTGMWADMTIFDLYNLYKK